MTESQPRNDFASFPAPAEGILVTMFLTVRKVARSRDFYSRILGGTVILEENPCTVRLSNTAANPCEPTWSGAAQQCADCVATPSAQSAQVAVTYLTLPMVPIPGLLLGRIKITRVAEMRVRE